jgi:hypothetical protein
MTSSELYDFLKQCDATVSSMPVALFEELSVRHAAEDFLVTLRHLIERGAQAAEDREVQA